MSTNFLEPGTDAINSFQWYAATSGTVTSDTGITARTGPRSIKCNSGAGNAAAWVRTVVSARSAGRFIAAFYITNLPSSTTAILSVQTGTSAVVAEVRVTSGGVLQLFEATNQIGSDGSTLSTGTWYQIEIVYSVTSTTVNNFRVFLNGNSTADISVTNATITNTSAGRHLAGWGTAPGASKVINVDDFFLESDATMATKGVVKVTSKLPNANNTNQFEVAIGANPTNRWENVYERPLSQTNGWNTAVASGTVDENYGIQNAATGDADLTGATIICRESWLWGDRDSGTGPTYYLWNNGSTANINLGLGASLFRNLVDSATYPSNAAAVGMGTIDGAVNLFECGMLIAYTPAAAGTAIKDIIANNSLIAFPR